MKPRTGAKRGTSHRQPWVLSGIVRERSGCSYQIVSSFSAPLQNSMWFGCQNIRTESSWQKCSARKGAAGSSHGKVPLRLRSERELAPPAWEAAFGQRGGSSDPRPQAPLRVLIAGPVWGRGLRKPCHCPKGIPSLTVELSSAYLKYIYIFY